MAGDMDPEELKRMKRDASIKSKHDEYEIRLKEEQENKKLALVNMKKEAEQLERDKVNERLAHLKRQAEARAKKKSNVEQLQKRRTERIASKEQAWLDRVNSEIKEVQKKSQEDEALVEQATQEARERKHAKEEVAAAKKRDAFALREELEARRAEQDTDRQQQRELKEINHVDQVKAAAQHELESFIQHPYPVPLKQVLAGRLRPVPKVTELLAAYKDQREDLKDLEEQDIPMRATLRNQTIFMYVRDLQQRAESERLKPPEPSPGDMGRGTARAGGFGRRSPSSRRAGTGKLGRTR